VGVDQCDFASRRLANVRDDVLAADRVACDQRGDRRIDGGARVDEHAASGAFEESNAKSIGVITGFATALMEAAKGETDVRRNVAVHSQQLAHKTGSPSPAESESVRGIGPLPDYRLPWPIER
jgi:hypothetical protein